MVELVIILMIAEYQKKIKDNLSMIGLRALSELVVKRQGPIITLFFVFWIGSTYDDGPELVGKLSSFQ